MNYDVFANVRVVLSDIEADNPHEAAEQARCILQNSENNGLEVSLEIVDIGCQPEENDKQAFCVQPGSDNDVDDFEYVEFDIDTLEEKGRYVFEP